MWYCALLIFQKEISDSWEWFKTIWLNNNITYFSVVGLLGLNQVFLFKNNRLSFLLTWKFKLVIRILKLVTRILKLLTGIFKLAKKIIFIFATQIFKLSKKKFFFSNLNIRVTNLNIRVIAKIKEKSFKEIFFLFLLTRIFELVTWIFKLLKKNFFW